MRHLGGRISGRIHTDDHLCRFVSLLKLIVLTSSLHPILTLGAIFGLAVEGLDAMMPGFRRLRWPFNQHREC
jgi:acyl dehydratase